MRGIPERDLIRVPACRDCNCGASKDDEYLCLILTLSQDVAGHAVASKARHKMVAALENPRKVGFRKTFANSFAFVDRVTRAGIVLGTEVGYRVDYSRVYRVISRLVRGLFFHLDDTRLPEHVVVRVVHFFPPAIRNEAAMTQVATMAQQILDGGHRHSIGGTAFTYARHVFDPDRPSETGWVFIFYERMIFMALTKDT